MTRKATPYIPSSAELAAIATSGSASDLGTGTLPSPRIAAASLAASQLLIDAAALNDASALRVFYSQVINFCTTGVYVLIPAMPFRFIRISINIELETVGGTRSSGMAINIGSNASNYDNIYNNQAATGILTQAANTVLSPGSTVSPAPVVNMTANGLKANQTGNITGSSPVCTGRIVVVGTLLPP